jgi:hypothetical protein
MSEGPTNGDIYDMLLTIKGDIGGLKASSDIHLAGLQNHSERIGKLEVDSGRQKGAATAWGVVAGAATAIVTAAVPYLFRRHS